MSTTANVEIESGLGESESPVGQIDQAQYTILAQEAMHEAEKITDEDAETKWDTFSKTLLDNCQRFGDDIPKRFVQVCAPSVSGSGTWWWLDYGSRLQFFETGSDRFRYVARVF